jgi:hypothetical protein
MNEVIIEAGQRTCRLEELFEPGFIELIRLAPRNPLVRGLILKLTGQMPPECATFEEVREWAESHCQKKSRPPVHGSVHPNEEEGIRIPVDFSETEYGRADYSVPRSGTDEFHLSAEELLEIIQDVIDADEGMNEIVDVIAEKIVDDAWNRCDPSLDDYGDYEYENHESNDSGNCETTCSRDQIRHRVLEFVRAHHPELAAEL